MATKKKVKRGYSRYGYYFPYHGWCEDMHNQDEEPVQDPEMVPPPEGGRFDPCHIGDWPPGPKPGDWPPNWVPGDWPPVLPPVYPYPTYPTFVWPMFEIPSFPNYQQTEKSNIDPKDSKKPLEMITPCENRLPCGTCKRTGNICPLYSTPIPIEDTIKF